MLSQVSSMAHTLTEPTFDQHLSNGYTRCSRISPTMLGSAGSSTFIMLRGLELHSHNTLQLFARRLPIRNAPFECLTQLTVIVTIDL